MAEKIIKSKERVKQHGEVYTPKKIVKEMLDMLEDESEDAFSVLTKTFLEPACGNGNFLVEIFRRKLVLCENPLDGVVALSSIYGIDILQDNIDEARKRLRDMYAEKFGEVLKAVDVVLSRNIVCGDFLTKKNADGSQIWFLEEGSEVKNEG